MIFRLFDWSTFSGENTLFPLSFSDGTVRMGNRRYFLPNVEIKDYKVIIDRQSFFDHSVKINMSTNDNIRKITTGQGDDYRTGCSLDYTHFKDYYHKIALDW